MFASNCPVYPLALRKLMKLTNPPNGVTALGVCVIFIFDSPQRDPIFACIVLFLSVVMVLGSNPFNYSI
jgi:hypothetical protein